MKNYFFLTHIENTLILDAFNSYGSDAQCRNGAYEFRETYLGKIGCRSNGRAKDNRRIVNRRGVFQGVKKKTSERRWCVKAQFSVI